MQFRFHRLKILDIILIECRKFTDDRGFFIETYELSEFSAHDIPHIFTQDNYSHSIKGVLRGLHYQKYPKGQGKLVRAQRGRIFDVGVDIRRGSPTYGQWEGAELSDDNCRMLYIPPGFAHGFCVLSDSADVVYKVTEKYAPEYDRGIIWNDPEINIRWPITEPILSTKDARLPLLKNADNNYVFQQT